MIIIRLDRVLADRKMRLNDLATQVGISNVNLSYLKTGKVKAIRFSTLDAICKVLNCQPGDILEYIEGEEEKQIIEYDVGFNQTIQVNSTADQCFKHGIGRTVDDLINSMQNVLDLEGVKANLERLLKEAEGTDAAVLQTQLDATDKALALAKDKCQKLFERGITVFQGHLDDTNLSITECGTRSSKLSLIKNRMQNQKTTFETLKSENEDVDITEIAIQLSSAELTYEAALMATGKVMQTTLLNFI